MSEEESPKESPKETLTPRMIALNYNMIRIFYKIGLRTRLLDNYGIDATEEWLAKPDIPSKYLLTDDYFIIKGLWRKLKRILLYDERIRFEE
jgi:hypothetical protein